MMELLYVFNPLLALILCAASIFCCKVQANTKDKGIPAKLFAVVSFALAAWTSLIVVNAMFRYSTEWWLPAECTFEETPPSAYSFERDYGQGKAHDFRTCLGVRASVTVLPNNAGPTWSVVTTTAPLAVCTADEAVGFWKEEMGGSGKVVDGKPVVQAPPKPMECWYDWWRKEEKVQLGPHPPPRGALGGLFYVISVLVVWAVLFGYWFAIISLIVQYSRILFLNNESRAPLGGTAEDVRTGALEFFCLRSLYDSYRWKMYEKRKAEAGYEELQDPKAEDDARLLGRFSELIEELDSAKGEFSTTAALEALCDWAKLNESRMPPLPTDKTDKIRALLESEHKEKVKPLCEYFLKLVDPEEGVSV